MTTREMVRCPDWIRVTDAVVPEGTSYWRLAKVEYQDDQRSGGTHHIYAQVPHDPSVQMQVSNGQQSWPVALDKPTNEPAANFAMWGGNQYSAQLQGRPSDRIEGMHMPSNHHVSYLLWWELATADGTGGQGEGGEGSEDNRIGGTGTTLEQALLDRGEAEQVLRFNPTAALQMVIFQQGFVPNSPEFTVTFDGTPYVGQRAERLSDGTVKVFYCRHGDWGNVQSVTRS